MALGLHTLGLPVVRKGLQGIVNYFRVLDTDERDRFLDPVGKRIGMVLLYFNCKELCEHAEKYCPGPIQKPPRSYVLNCILDAYCDDPQPD
jgi:hypothetical protein